MLKFLTAGESHGPCLTVIVDRFPAGLPVDSEVINSDLERRQRGYGRGNRMAIEQDRVEILSGVLYGKTTGAPVAMQIENKDWGNWREEWASRSLPSLTVPRPGHADYAGMKKYRLDDARLVLERASARETAGRVAVGALARLLLREFEVAVGSYIRQIGEISAKIPEMRHEELWARAEVSPVRCPDDEGSEQMCRCIDRARQRGDTLGGVFTVTATGVPIGLGSHAQWDRRLDARVAWAVMSIPAIKGVEIGPAFANARKPGTEVHDEFTAESGSVTRTSNRAGGFEGGMTNGMPIVVHAAMKPIPSTIRPLRSVDLATGEPAETAYERSDICAVPAAAIVGEAVVAWVVADALVEKLGGDSLAEMRAHARGI